AVDRSLEFALDPFKAIAAGPGGGHLDDRFGPESQPGAHGKTIDVNALDDKLLTHLTGASPEVFEAELLERVGRHDIELTFATPALAVAGNPAIRDQDRSGKRRARVVVFRAWVVRGRRVHDAHDAGQA